MINDFITAMANMPAPVAIVTTGAEGARVGMTVSAVSSLSVDPPSILVCINKNATAYADVIANRRFGVNIVHFEQADITLHFAQKDVDRFSHGQWQQSRTDVPLLTGAAAAIACTIAAEYDGFSHAILVGRVDEIILATGETIHPVAYANRKFRKVG